MAEPTRDQVHALYIHALGRITALGDGGAAERVGPWLCVDAGLGVSDFNVAVVVEPVANPAVALREAMNWFAYRGINCRVDLRASVDGPLLAAAMVEGLVFKFREPAMVLHPLPSAFPAHLPLSLQRVESEADIVSYCSVDRDEYHDQDFQRAMVERSLVMPGVTLHLGLLDGRPVARSMGMVQGELVAIHNVYVAPSQRKRGFGSAITAAAIEAGMSAGATGACLEATILGFSVYEAMGFRKIDDYVVMGTDTPLFPR
ncbi:MAG: GNAT family N-acetyltransferase [Dehalococcoidia bacterium]